MNYEDHPQVIDTILSIDELRDRLEYLNVQISQLQRPEDKVERLHTLYALTEKYENLYVRSCLDKEEGSLELKRNVVHDLRTMGMTIGRDPHFYFKEQKYNIIVELKAMGQPVDEHLDLY